MGRRSAIKKLHKIRLGAYYIDKNEKCCSVTANIEHILLNCKKIEDIKSNKIKETANLDINDTEKMKRITSDLNESNIENIHTIVKTWRERRDPG